MCHASPMPLHELSTDEANTIRHASLIADPETRVSAVLDIVQTVVDKHVAQRSADMTARFEQSLGDFVREQQGSVGLVAD